MLESGLCQKNLGGCDEVLRPLQRGVNFIGRYRRIGLIVARLTQVLRVNQIAVQPHIQQLRLGEFPPKRGNDRCVAGKGLARASSRASAA